MQRFCPEGHIFTGIDIIVGIFHRIDREVSVTSRDERIFKRLAAGSAAVALVGVFGCLGVIYLKVRREVDFRLLQKSHISATGDSDDQGGSIVGLEVVRGETRGYSEISDTATE